MFLVTLATFKVTHIFDDSYGRDFKLIKHLNTLNDIYICEFLRRGHYDCRFNVDFLAECQLNVARARGEIHNEVVEIAPVSVADELIHEVGSYRASHDSRTMTLSCVLSHEAVTHSFHSTELNRTNHGWVVFILEKLSVLRTDHGRQTRPIQISIEYSNLIIHVHAGYGVCEVDSDRGLADTPLARADSDDVLDLLEAFLKMMSRFCLLWGGGHGHFDLGSPGQLGLKSVLHDGFDLSIVTGKV